MEPADFPEIEGRTQDHRSFPGRSINPKRTYPGKDGTLLMVGFKGKDEPRGVYSMAPGKDAVDKIGMPDGLY